MATTTPSHVHDTTWPQQSFRSPGMTGLSFDDVYERQEALPHYLTKRLRDAEIFVAGAGGLATYVCGSLLRKGLGRLVIADEDTVEMSNLNRQGFFSEDLFEPKAIAMAKHCCRHSLLGCVTTGHQVDFDAASSDILITDAIDLAFVGVDNNQTRAWASKYFRLRQIPVIFSAVNEGANYGYVFLQKAEGACLGCVYPDAMREGEQEPRRCTSSPAVLDILQAVGAMALYAADHVLMERPCNWTFRSLSLVDSRDDVAAIAQKYPDCPLCGSAGREIRSDVCVA